MDLFKEKLSEKIEKAIDSYKFGLSKLRSGTANPAMLNGIKCDYYGEKMDIVNLCSISRPEPRQLVVKPYSREDVKSVASAIAAANIGINPQIESDCIRIIVPALTEDIRKDTVKQAKSLSEEAKVSVRNARREVLKLIDDDDSMSDDYKDIEIKDVEKEVEKAMKSIEEILNVKSKEIMSI